VISETIDGEVVIINLGTGNYYSLQGTGAVLWRGIEQGATRDELVEHLATSHADASGVDAAVDSFVEQLLGDELVVPADGEPPGPPVLDPPVTARFEVPLLERFTDMTDLILLDPVHDVDAAAGWPRAKRPAQEAAGDLT
jgi:hypothetical protein